VTNKDGSKTTKEKDGNCVRTKTVSKDGSSTSITTCCGSGCDKGDDKPKEWGNPNAAKPDADYTYNRLFNKIQLNIHNQHRKDYKSPPLLVDGSVAQKAQEYADFMKN